MLLTLCLGLHILAVNATERIIECKTRGCEYEVYVDAPDTWTIYTRLKVTVRLTLIRKGIEDRQVEYVTNSSHPGLEFLYLNVHDGNHRLSTWDSVQRYESVNLTREGDYWEKQFSLSMESWVANQLERGERVEATLGVRFYLDEYGANYTLLGVPTVGTVRQYVGDDPIRISIVRPFFSAIETYAVGGVGAFMAFGLLAFTLHKLGVVPLCRWGYHNWRDYGDRVVVRWREPRVVDDPTRPHVTKVRKEDAVMSRRKCVHCGLDQKRKFTKTEDSTWETVGWEDNGDSDLQSQARTRRNQKEAG